MISFESNLETKNKKIQDPLWALFYTMISSINYYTQHKIHKLYKNVKNVSLSNSFKVKQRFNTFQIILLVIERISKVNAKLAYKDSLFFVNFIQPLSGIIKLQPKSCKWFEGCKQTKVSNELDGYILYMGLS